MSNHTKASTLLVLTLLFTTLFVGAAAADPVDLIDTDGETVEEDDSSALDSEEENPDEDGIPGFTLVVAAIAVLATFVIVVRRVASSE